MAFTLNATNYTLLDDCEDATTWNGESPTDVTDFYKYGTQCVGFTIRDLAQIDIYLDTGTYDLSGTVHLRCWFMTTALKEMDLFANDGVQFYVTDGTNTAYWTVLGSDTYPGGWYPLVVDLSSSPTSGTKPTDMSVCTTIGLRFNTTANAKNSQNTWIDHLHLSDGLEVYGDDGASGDIDFDQIAATDDGDATNGGFGTLRKIAGNFYATGEIVLGDATGTTGLDFSDTSQDITFEDRPVNSSLYKLKVVNNATGTANFQLGAKSGDAGISGCKLKTESGSQSAKFAIDVSDADVDVMKIYGCTFQDAAATTLPTVDSNKEVISCNFEACGDVTVSTCKVEYCKFIDADDNGIVASSTSMDVDNCDFISCPTGMKLTAAGTYSSPGNIFTGCTVDIENSSTATNTDSYSDSNQDGAQAIGNGTTVAAGQSITGDGNVLSNVALDLRKVLSPTGNLVVKIYAHTGTFGTSGTPTGAALATSEVFDVSDLGTTLALTKIDFEDEFTLVNTTKYFVVVEYSGGDASNYIEWGYDGSSPGHGGNFATYVSSWSADSAKDACFYVRTGGIVTVNKTGGSNPSTEDNTGTVPGTIIISATFTFTLTNLELNTEVTIVVVDTSTELHHTENATVSDGEGKYKDTYDHSGGATVDVLIHHPSYKPHISSIYSLALPNADSSAKVAMFADDNYYNPA